MTHAHKENRSSFYLVF